MNDVLQAKRQHTGSMTAPNCDGLAIVTAAAATLAGGGGSDGSSARLLMANSRDARAPSPPAGSRALSACHLMGHDDGCDVSASPAKTVAACEEVSSGAVLACPPVQQPT